MPYSAFASLCEKSEEGNHSGSICAAILHCVDKYLVALQILSSLGCYVRHAVTPRVSSRR
jgi:hypothetical protein